LILRAIDLRHDWWVTDDSLLPYIVETVDGCTTTEARICMATAFNLFLDAFPPNDDGPALGEAVRRVQALGVEGECSATERLAVIFEDVVEHVPTADRAADVPVPLDGLHRSRTVTRW
jgi:hypothetical protein